MSMISPAQMRLLHIAPKQLGMDEEIFKGLLKDLTMKESIRASDGKEARACLVEDGVR